MILKGTIYITDNEDIIYQTPLNGNTKIISLDEDGVLMENDAILVGTCLLPPIEAKIAEADGNEPLYDTIYSNHLLEPYQQQFISALLSYLYKGGNLILFLPELGCTNTKEKFIYHMYKLYGIHCGLIGHPDLSVSNYYYDERCIPLWLNMIYSVHVISAYEYLYMYPADAIIQNIAILSELIDEINPYGESINDKINYILHLHKLIHKQPSVKPAIICRRRM